MKEDDICPPLHANVSKGDNSDGSEDDIIFTGWDRAGYNWQGWDLAVILINMVNQHFDCLSMYSTYFYTSKEVVLF